MKYIDYIYIIYYMYGISPRKGGGRGTVGLLMIWEGLAQTPPAVFCLSESFGWPSGSMKSSPAKFASSASRGYMRS